MTFAWGAVYRAKIGQDVSGDVYLIHEYADGSVLAAVIDGLGGGEEAARAAHTAEETIRQHIEWPLQDLMRRAHSALQSTRGAVIGLLRLGQEEHEVRFVGVGNIGIHAYSRQLIRPISKNGIIGYRLPTLLELSYAYDPGDIFVLYSDGVSGHFVLDGKIDIKQPPQQLAEQILADYGKQTDDATVVVMKTMASV